MRKRKLRPRSEIAPKAEESTRSSLSVRARTAGARKIDPDQVWAALLRIGKGWTLQILVDELKESGIPTSRSGLRRVIDVNEMIPRAEKIWAADADLSPVARELMAEVRERVKLEDLNSSVEAMEAFNLAVKKVAAKIAEAVDMIKIEKPGELATLISVLGSALTSSSETRATYAEVKGLVDKMAGNAKPPAQGASAPSNVTNLKDRLNAIANG